MKLSIATLQVREIVEKGKEEGVCIGRIEYIKK